MNADADERDSIRMDDSPGFDLMSHWADQPEQSLNDLARVDRPRPLTRGRKLIQMITPCVHAQFQSASGGL